MKKDISQAQKALNVWAIILIIWSFYRVKFKLPEWFDEFIAKPFIFIFPIYLYIRRVEKGSFFKSLDFNLKAPFNHYLIGFFLGLTFFLTALLSTFARTGRLVFFPEKNFTPQSLILFLAIPIATAISEEILSRGFILKRLYEESKNIYTSSFFASFLFFFLHVPILFTNAKITGSLILFIMSTDLLLSLISSFIFLSKRSLIIPILIHALYNLTIYYFT